MGIDFGELFTDDDEDSNDLIAFTATGQKVIGTAETVVIGDQIQINAVITDQSYIHMIDDGTLTTTE